MALYMHCRFTQFEILYLSRSDAKTLRRHSCSIWTNHNSIFLQGEYKDGHISMSRMVVSRLLIMYRKLKRRKFLQHLNFSPFLANNALFNLPYNGNLVVSDVSDHCGVIGSGGSSALDLPSLFSVLVLYPCIVVHVPPVPPLLSRRCFVVANNFFVPFPPPYGVCSISSIRFYFVLS